MNTCPSHSLFSFVFSLPSPFSLPPTSLGLCQKHLSKRSFLLSTSLRKRHHSHLVGGWSAKRLTYSFSSIFFPFSFFSHACLPLGHGLRQRRQKPLGVQQKHKPWVRLQGTGRRFTTATLDETGRNFAKPSQVSQGF